MRLLRAALGAAFALALCAPAQAQTKIAVG